MTDSFPSRQFLPNATIGVLGSGQLGRMFAIAAKQMGYQVHVFSPTPQSPAGQVADREVHAAYDNIQAVEEFARNVDVITLEFENVPVSTVDAAAQYAPVHPGRNVLETTQHRLLEKEFLKGNGIPVAGFAAIKSLEDLHQASKTLTPGVLKTTTLGYDGKGQAVIGHADEIDSAWSSLETDEAILEAFIDLDCEFSVVAARCGDGRFKAFDPIRNEHRHHILDMSVSPSGLSEEIILRATEITGHVMQKLDVVGVLCIEFFLSRQGELMVNEIAPRCHNSGHLTIDSHVTSQFEQQVRAVCGLSLGSTRQKEPAAMVNLLGDCWESGTPNWSTVLSIPEAKLHLYGKSTPAAKRKMGHITTLAANPEEAIRRAVGAREAVHSGQPLPKSEEQDDALTTDAKSC